MTKTATKVKEVIIEEIKPLPKPLSFVEFKKGQDRFDLPASPLPYYVLSQEGIFQHQVNTLGTATLRIDKMPTHLGELGHKNGFFDYNATTVPKEICAQIVDFFRRIWKNHKAEAEVILTAKIESTDGFPKIVEWRVFIPTQKVSMGGVESVYEPSHIAKGYQVVGTMHSHCNFSAFHSGTDTNDASSFDGLHLTIGMVDRDEPQVTAMVSSAGYMVDLDKKLAEVADFSDLDAAQAPTWWDNYVIPTKDLVTKHRPAGFQLFDKYPKNQPTTTPNRNHQGRGWGGDFGDYGDYGSQYNCTHAFTCTCDAIGHKFCCQKYEEDKACSHASTCQCEITYHKVCCKKRPIEVPKLPAKTESKAPITKTLSDIVKEEEKDNKTNNKKSSETDLIDKVTADDFDLLQSKLRDLLFDNDLLSDDDIDRLSECKTEEKTNTLLRAVLFRKMSAARDALRNVGVDISLVVTNNGTQKVVTNKKKGGTKKNGRSN